MQFKEPNNRGYCVVCQKIVPIRDVRASKATYCSQKCASQTRYQKRFRGTGSGPMNRPESSKPVERMKWNG